jgi:hypothetical protein
MNPSILVSLPCCQTTIKATGRRSKQRQRPRQHFCPKCGRPWLINLANPNKPVVKSVSEFVPSRVIEGE